MKPTAIDLCCGLGGWTEGLLSEGWHVIGYDIERHDYGTGGYPGELILADITTLHGSQFKDASLFVASPPCQDYSYMAMPWSRAKAKAAMIEADTTGEELRKLNLLFDTCFRLQREASEAAGHHIPMIVENVRGAQKWVGRAAYHYGSFYLWGDVPALMPVASGFKAKSTLPLVRGDFAWNKSEALQEARRDGVKADGSGWTEKGSLASHNRLVSNQGVKVAAKDDATGNKMGGDWFSDPTSTCRKHGSKSPARKAASAMIAKIPYPLSQYIAHHFHPERYIP